MIVLVVTVVGGIGYVTDWFGFAKGATGGSGSGDGATGDLGSLKYSVRTVTEDTPTQFAGTGYCWDVKTPKQLIESATGKTLSATAGTSFSNAYRDSTYECTSFSSTTYCDHATDKMVKEGLDLRSDCYNLSSGRYLDVVFYERGTEETTNSLTITAGTSKSYNKFYAENNGTDVNYPLKAVCVGSNVSDSQLSDLKISGWTRDNDEPEWLSSDADDYCFTKSEAIVFTEGMGKEFLETITFEMASGFASPELLNVTFHDECEYVSASGDIKKDYFARDTTAQLDCGTIPQTESITLVPA